MKVEVRSITNGLIPELTLELVGMIGNQTDPARGILQSDPMPDELASTFPDSPSETFEDRGNEIPTPGGYMVPHARTSPPSVARDESLGLSAKRSAPRVRFLDDKPSAQFLPLADGAIMIHTRLSAGVLGLSQEVSAFPQNVVGGVQDVYAGYTCQEITEWTNKVAEECDLHSNSNQVGEVSNS